MCRDLELTDNTGLAFLHCPLSVECLHSSCLSTFLLFILKDKLRCNFTAKNTSNFLLLMVLMMVDNHIVS